MQVAVKDFFLFSFFITGGGVDWGHKQMFVFLNKMNIMLCKIKAFLQIFYLSFACLLYVVKMDHHQVFWRHLAWIQQPKGGDVDRGGKGFASLDQVQAVKCLF